MDSQIFDTIKSMENQAFDPKERKNEYYRKQFYESGLKKTDKCYNIDSYFRKYIKEMIKSGLKDQARVLFKSKYPNDIRNFTNWAHAVEEYKPKLQANGKKRQGRPRKNKFEKTQEIPQKTKINKKRRRKPYIRLIKNRQAKIKSEQNQVLSYTRFQQSKLKTDSIYESNDSLQNQTYEEQSINNYQNEQDEQPYISDNFESNQVSNIQNNNVNTIGYEFDIYYHSQVQNQNEFVYENNNSTENEFVQCAENILNNNNNLIFFD